MRKYVLRFFYLIGRVLGRFIKLHKVKATILVLKSKVVWDVDAIAIFGRTAVDAKDIFDCAAKIYKKVSTDLNRFHPTQKPIELYDFVFNYAKVKEGMKVIDTHLGSGSSRISANKNKLHFVGCETSLEYYDKQNKRYADFISQTRLF